MPVSNKELNSDFTSSRSEERRVGKECIELEKSQTAKAHVCMARGLTKDMKQLHRIY